MSLSDVIGLAGIVATVIGLLVSVYTGGDINLLSLLNRKRYKRLDGDYKLWNKSREHIERTIEWDVTIRTLPLRLPAVTLKHNEYFDLEYRGYVRVNQDQLYIVLRNENSNMRKMSFLVFHNFSEKTVRLEAGILCSFEEPTRPYAGIHVLADANIPKEVAVAVLEQSGPSPKLDYLPFFRAAGDAAIKTLGQGGSA